MLWSIGQGLESENRFKKTCYLKVLNNSKFSYNTNNYPHIITNRTMCPWRNVCAWFRITIWEMHPYHMWFRNQPTWLLRSKTSLKCFACYHIQSNFQFPTRCDEHDMKRLRYSVTGDIVCDCMEGWERHEDGVGNNFTCHQHSTQAWCKEGDILQVKIQLLMIPLIFFHAYIGIGM